MKVAATHEPDDTYIENAWKYAETEEIEDLAAELLGKALEAQSIEDDLFCILYLAFRCGFKTAIGQQPGETEMFERRSQMPARTYGTVSAEMRKEMTGLQFVQGLANRTLPLNTIARTLGYDVSEAEQGRVVVAMTPGEDHLNPAGTVHGGLTATLLDSCMGLAVQSTLEKSEAQTTLEFKISLVRPITPETGPIRAEGVVLNRGRRIGTAEGRVTDGNGRLLAHGTTTCLIFPG
jgi:uncharacterized protein (TIGR00369 family)